MKKNFGCQINAGFTVPSLKYSPGAFDRVNTVCIILPYVTAIKYCRFFFFGVEIFRGIQNIVRIVTICFIF